MTGYDSNSNVNTINSFNAQKIHHNCSCEFARLIIKMVIYYPHHVKYHVNVVPKKDYNKLLF